MIKASEIHQANMAQGIRAFLIDLFILIQKM